MNLKICLLDLNHKTRGVHTNTTPLGIGLIAEFVQGQSKFCHDIRLYKEHDDLLDELKLYIPDIVGIAQYAWNSELNYWAVKLIKKLNPKCIIVAGGPNLESDNDLRVKYFQKYRHIDICIEYDG